MTARLLEPPLHGPSFFSKDEVSFRVWAPNAKKIELELFYPDRSKNLVPMKSLQCGYFEASTDASENLRYNFLINGSKRRPDPASRFQPEGVHGPSSVVIPDEFGWHDSMWRGVPSNDLFIYELHVGTYTKEGTFEAIIPYLDYLTELGITSIELMPVAQFPGNRNWGYDGVDLYSPQNSYGGPRGLKKLVDHSHQKGLSVILDVVYNHVGPEGNYLSEFGPYFSHKYTTPWGPAVNYDDAGCDEVRKFVVQNAVYWIDEFHIDGLRLDAVNRIFDYSPRNILLEVRENVHEAAEVKGREVHVMAESDFNDPKLLLPKEIGGYSVDAQWSDDFHHAVHTYLTGERFGYYADFGDISDIAKALSSAFVYDGKYSVYRNRKHGSPAGEIGGEKFVYCIQNHDQVGNHPKVERLSTLLNFDRLKVAASLLILSQSIPLFFMGEEYAETAPFNYFVSHTEKEIVERVREGRKKEHEDKGPRRLHLDPQAETTFLQSKLDHSLRSKKRHKITLEYYRDLIHLRKSLLPLKDLARSSQQIILIKERDTIIMNRQFEEEVVKCFFVLSEEAVELEDPLSDGYALVFDSTSYMEKGMTEIDPKSTSMKRNIRPPMSVAVFAKQKMEY